MSAAQPYRPPTGPYERRSAGLLRVRRVTRWTLVGSAASALVLGLGYAHALPDLASLLPSHASDGGSGGGGGGGVGDFTGGGGAQAPSLPGAGSGGSHTSTGAS
ncbi:hypothetical protein [Streptacidiphilus anmyonensis]|uniref:hypothetical protein n=1 Tax=Streptacidiphilus anmyonensis TaxID=405782 RepID=UPI0005AA71A8|nr:hypothetical protein [Streptacidiphilus anmyonensis]